MGLLAPGSAKRAGSRNNDTNVSDVFSDSDQESILAALESLNVLSSLEGKSGLSIITTVMTLPSKLEKALGTDLWKRLDALIESVITGSASINDLMKGFSNPKLITSLETLFSKFES